LVYFISRAGSEIRREDFIGFTEYVSLVYGKGNIIGSAQETASQGALVGRFSRESVNSKRRKPPPEAAAKGRSLMGKSL